jgi:non-specific serine/threonine protein kinase
VQEGETWLVSFGSESVRMKDADGLRYLAYLVARPDVAVPVVELFGERAKAGGETGASGGGDAGEVLDREAIAAYRERARELRESLEEAEGRHDHGAAERARKELEFLEQELSRAVGLGGRSRRAASDHERIRVNVTTRIRKSLERLGEQNPRLARHLKASIRTGSICTYEPP